jgi:hypothetical protein
MGRKLEGSAPRAKLVAIRLNPEEEQDLEQKRARRGLGISDYFRTLMKEDD